MFRVIVSHHELFALLGIGIALVRYVLYFKDIYRGTAKPHVFSWFVWGLLGAIAFFAQVSEGAGTGAWVTGLVSIACFTISFVAFLKKETEITRSDKITFVFALAAAILWIVTKSPLLAVIIVSIADALGYVPTYRKSYTKPYDEPLNGYVLATFRSIFGILALQSFTITTWLYPATLILSDGGFVLMLLLRRRQLKREEAI